jgi:hypothetical protein
MNTVIAGADLSRKIIPVGKIDSYKVRFALGVGALLIEPGVDFYSNKKMNKECRWYSVVKTGMKIIIGTATGVTARYFGQKIGAGFFTQKIRALLKENKNLITQAKAKLSKVKPEDILHFPIDRVLVENVSKKLKINQPKSEDIARKLIIDPTSISEDLAKAFGDFTGVLTAGLFTLAIDAPLISKTINYTMDRFFPGYNLQSQNKKNQVGCKKL